MGQPTNCASMSFVESIDAATLGERLRVARANAGLTQEDAAKRLGVSRPTLVAIEQGQRKVRAEELRTLADIYEARFNDLLRSTAVHVDLVAKFRKGDSKKQTELEKSGEDAIRLLNRLATASMELEFRLGQRQQSYPPPEKQILSGPLEDQAEDLALELRHRLGIGLSPITDIVSLVELELGVRIFFRPLAPLISGVFAYDAAVGPCMLINIKHPRERQVLTIAHELGHFMCARNSPDVVHEAAHEISREERFVTLFAVAFLMPAVSVRSRFRDYTAAGGAFSPRNLLLMAHSFKVSVEAMARRLENLKLLKQGTFESLKERGFTIEAAKRALGLPTDDAQSAPPRLTLMAVEAYRRGLFSEGQLSNMLSLERVQLREQLDNFGGEELDDALSLES
ncbi:XRE family transcriptional regulator [Ereboglobus luteus]|uniref:HTH cro/C1-type domain-containing protein n=1 Tax=Ereboglobus luteus TaxID=1796921 RepID=A0A2U8E4N9_9BACT|nr:XRE family transcriptional regulator [Ereboglobus luteus]AWI09514.1 hypothetical protein CKA38_09895 [Ereboglobus luteus]